MFDPTTYDNLKVVVEGAVYDLDLDGTVEVTARSDTTDTADMSRFFTIRYRLRGSEQAQAGISLHAGIRDLAAEILDEQEDGFGCRLSIAFQTRIGADYRADLMKVRQALSELWEHRPAFVQRVTLSWPDDGEEGEPFALSVTTLDFGRKIGESQIADIPELVACTSRSLAVLDELRFSDSGKADF